MLSSKSYKIIIAETAPVILSGLIDTIKKIKELPSRIIEVDTKESLFNVVTSDYIDLLIVNPTFSGLLHPDDIRKTSNNPDIKILAFEIGKLSRSTQSLYDDHFHVTDDMAEIKSKILSTIKLNQEESEEKENLSVREKEIIINVVKGLTNHEIADKLFISVHTVMTHRRNIAKKLQIHSATGLTIYAIVNKLVDLTEIKL